MPYIAKQDSKVTQKYWWQNPNNENEVAFELERYYPGWIAVDHWIRKDGRDFLVKAYVPDEVEPEPVPAPEPTPEPEPITEGCIHRVFCPFYNKTMEG